MSTEQIIKMIFNFGVPTAILVWVLWRADYFLRYLVNKLDTFNDELNAINLTLKDLANQLRR